MLRRLRQLLFVFLASVLFLIFVFSKQLISTDDDCLDVSLHNKFNESGHLDNERHWKKLSAGTHVFSAYFDNREPCSTLLTVFGFGTKSDEPLYGTLVLQNGTKVGLTSIAKRTELNIFGKYNNDKLGPYTYTWTLPFQGSILNELKSIVVNQVSTVRTLSIAEIPITFPTYSSKIFGVCIDSPIFDVKPSTIVENIELNKVLGAEWFTIYVYKASEVVSQVLMEYVNEGSAEVVQNWGVDLPNPVHYYGQTLSINECAYRNMFRVKYLVFTDLDEFIVPRKSLSWSEMMEELEDPDYGTYIFKHVFFLRKENDKLPQNIICNVNGIHLNWPKFLTHNYRSRKIYPSRIRSKYIIKPLLMKKIGVHEIFEHLYNHLHVFVVDSNTAILHHYRSFESVPDVIRNELNEMNILLDETALVYSRKILPVYKKRLCTNLYISKNTGN